MDPWDLLDVLSDRHLALARQAASLLVVVGDQEVGHVNPDMSVAKSATRKQSQLHIDGSKHIHIHIYIYDISILYVHLFIDYTQKSQRLWTRHDPQLQMLDVFLRSETVTARA